MECLRIFAQAVHWLYTNGFFALLQLIIVFVGLAFTVHQVAHATRTFQASVVGQLATQSNNLQWEILKDADLRPIILGANTEADARRAAVMGIAINHFATIYDLHLLGGIPPGTWESFEKDLKGTLAAPAFRQRWAQLKIGHRREFVAYVDSFLVPNNAPQAR
jgi:hypothetical protein